MNPSNNLRMPILIVGLILLSGVRSGPVTAANVTIVASRDATLFQDLSGGTSNGAGQYLFVGQNNSMSSIRRALVFFDLSGQIPMWATVDSAKLTLKVSISHSGDKSVGIRRVTSDWDEGLSDAGGEEGGGAGATTGDATWIHTSYDDEFWTNPGGDFVVTTSASIVIGDAMAPVTWGSTAQMVADVDFWLGKPDSNFGWILINDDEVTQTTKRYDSRESPTAANRPRLTLWYTPFGTCNCPRQGDMNGDGVHDAVDLNAVIDALYFAGSDPQDGQCPTMRSDANSDGGGDMIDLEYMIDVLFFNGDFPVNPCSL
jgi:hypothetical protein